MPTMTGKELETKLLKQAEEANGPAKITREERTYVHAISASYEAAVTEGKKNGWSLGQVKSEFARNVNMATEDLGSMSATRPTLDNNDMSRLERTARQAIDMAFIPK